MTSSDKGNDEFDLKLDIYYLNLIYLIISSHTIVNFQNLGTGYFLLHFQLIFTVIH